MIHAEYDVHGANLDELLKVGHSRAKQLVGDREYEFHMDVSQAVKSTNSSEQLRWVAECQVVLRDAR